MATPYWRSMMYARNAFKLYSTQLTEHAHHGASYWRSKKYACDASKLYIALLAQYNV